MKRSLIKQFNLLIVVTVVIYIISAVSLYGFVLKNVIDRLQEEILLSNAKEVAYIVDKYVEDEIMMLSRFVNTQRSKNWLMDIDNEQYYLNMDEALRTYSNLISVDSIFFVDSETHSYYRSTRENGILSLPKFDEVLEVTDESDSWYFNTISSVDEYDINIGKSFDSDDICLWINIVVRSDEEKIGVIGCSMPIDTIINKMTQKSVTSENTFVVDELGSIQLSSNIDLIREDSFQKEFGSGRSIYSVVNDSHVIKLIEEFLQDETRDVEIIKVDGTKIKSVVVSKIPTIDWTVIHIYNGGSLIEIRGITMGIAVLIMLSSIMGFLLVRFTRLKLLLPIKEVREQVTTFEKTSEINDLTIGENEIGLLSSSIITMETAIHKNRQNLEKELKTREMEVHKLYKDISRNEKNLKRLLETLPIGVVRFNTELDMVYSNHSALELFGVKSLNEYRKKLLKCKFFPYVSQEDKEHLKATILKNQVLIDYRLKLQVSSFRQLDVLLNVYQVDIEGEVFYEGVMKDITKNIKYEKQLIKRANYDNLTGVLSRAAFINHLDEYISYRFKDKSYSYFVAFDFDYFKLINDKYGHLAGDQVLKSVLDTLTSLIGDLGIIGRIGGDEFAAIIWEVHENHLYEFLDQLRKAIEEQDINYNGETLKVTISIGYTTCRMTDDFKSLYYRSDQALYEAKGLGKNKICKNDN